MSAAIASQLECLPDTTIMASDTLEMPWREKIQVAITGSSPPSYWVAPHTQASLSEIVQCAHRERWTILPCGSGSKLNWGGLVKSPQLALSTQRLNQIIEHAVGDLTVTVEAGVKLADIQAKLQQYQQFLPLDPAYPDSATLGGIVATADAGSWRQRYGGVRDMVLGLSFVRADGAIAKAGGRVVKNVAGYDLMKLFTGSYGTLGIISQITFRVYPLPKASRTLLLTGEAEAIAIASQTLLKSSLTPTAADALSASLVSRLESGRGMGLLIRFQSIPESVQEQAQHLATLAQQVGLQIASYDNNDESALWQRLQSFISLPATEAAVTCKIGVMPTSAIPLLTHLDQLTADRGLGRVHLSSGLGKLQLGEDTTLQQIKVLRSRCQDSHGFLTILEAPAEIKQQLEPWGYAGNALEMMKKIKQKFDPENCFSPGRFISY